MGEAELVELVGLLVGTVRRLFKATQNTGLESVIFIGVYNSVVFKA
jgi:hypothetical protein